MLFIYVKFRYFVKILIWDSVNIIVIICEYKKIIEKFLEKINFKFDFKEFVC